MRNLIIQSVLAASLIAFLPWGQAQGQTPPGIFPIASGFSVAYPAGWTQRNYANLRELWRIDPAQLADLNADQSDEVIKIQSVVIKCADHNEALNRLRTIEAEWGMTSKYITIAGWPALQRRQLVPKPREGADVGPAGFLYMITTAVAADTTVVRLDGFAPDSTPTSILSEIEGIGQALQSQVAGSQGRSRREVDQLRKSPSLRMPASSSKAAPRFESNGPGLQPSSATPAIVAANIGTFNLNIGSESEIAVSSNGTNVVVAQQCSFKTSNNGGQTFPFGGGYPFSPGKCTGGDTSLAFGQSGNFYWSTIGSNNPTCPAPVPPALVNNCNNTQQMARSTNNGDNFSFVTNVIDCRVTAGCGFGNVPDQEHIAADRTNAGGGGDQVYLAFRKGFGYGIQCSQDSGANWTAVAYHTGGSIDFPRITVAPNGTVFVVTNNGNNINLDSFSSCSAGFAQNLNQVSIVSGINQVACPVAGLDRCNDGNTLSSHTVAVDDTNSSHLYAAYAVNTAAGNPGNDNVLVRHSTDGGSTWSAAVQLNQAVTGRRYQPWVCSTGGRAFVSWQDRRASTAGANDLTDYWGGSAFVSAGNLTAGADFRINGASDPQCASGWPCLTRSTNDSESCSTQPQLAGTCRHTPNNAMDSNTPCDFSSTTCPTMETCQGGGGCPKYGDYTGSACALGRFYSVWPSATDQPGAASTFGSINSFFAETAVTPTPTTTTYTGDLTQDYHDTANFSATLVLSGTAVPVTGQTITFTLGTQSCAGVTNASGVASCSFVITQIPGNYSVVASFAGSGNFQSSSDTKAFVITREETTVSYNGDTVVGNGNTAHMSGTLLEDGNLAAPIAGRTLTFTLGTGGSAQTCNGLTNASGVATCNIVVNQPFGAQPVNTSFAGDAYYLPSSNSATLIVPAPPTITKSFTDFQIDLFFGVTNLNFTITNPPVNPIPLTGIAFTDNLPNELIIAVYPPNTVTGSCGGGTITAVPGTRLISLSNATLPVMGTCNFSVLVNGAEIGLDTNVTSNITSTTGGGLTGTPASAPISVVFLEFMWFFLAP